MKIEGSAALVAGGASGLGEATVRALHERGAAVTIADVNAEKGEALANALHERAGFIQCDVSDESQVEAAVQRAGMDGKELRISVCCAGVGWAVHAGNGCDGGWGAGAGSAAAGGFGMRDRAGGPDGRRAGVARGRCEARAETRRR